MLNEILQIFLKEHFRFLMESFKDSKNSSPGILSDPDWVSTTAYVHQGFKCILLALLNRAFQKS